MPDSHMSQQSNLDIFDNFKAQLTWGLWSHIQLLSGWTLRNSATKRKNGISLSKPSLQPRGFTKKTSKNNMLLCKEASRRAWRVITHIARFQLFQGFDDWITCTYFQQSKGCSQPIKSPAGRFGLLIWRAKGFAHQCSKPRLFEATGRWSLVVLGHLENFSCLSFSSPLFFKFKQGGSPKIRLFCQQKLRSKQHLWINLSGVWVFFWVEQKGPSMPRPKRNRDGEGGMNSSRFFSLPVIFLWKDSRKVRSKTEVMHNT